MSKVGFIGLGTMGFPMAKRILNAGHTLYVTNRTTSLLAEGAILRSSYKELAQDVDVVIFCLPNSDIVESVVFEPGNMAEEMGDNKLLIDMGTSSPESTIKISKHINDIGGEMIDAPVSGGKSGAINGALSCMVGGTERAFQRGLIVLKSLADTIEHVGPVGAGHKLKLLNNMIGVSNLITLCEVYAMAEELNIDLEIATKVFAGGSAGSKALEMWGNRLSIRDYDEPSYSFKLAKKDMELAQALSVSSGMPYPVFSVIHQVFRMVGGGLEDKDVSSIKSFWDQHINIKGEKL